MLPISTRLIVAGLLGHAFSQTSTFFSPGVPTDAPIPGNYTGPYRPRVHFSPPQNFMNDPNGMFVDANGTWHLYYQYDPTGIVAGNQHWGHATSTDLYHWENQKIALWTPNNFTFVFSGSCVVDVNNTSGFFPDQDNGVVAIYTLAQYPGGVMGIEQQAIAYSRDGGYTFEAYADNPVIPSNSTQFRDPKVIWHAPTERWVMVVAYPVDFTIGFYTSTNLKEWEHVSNLTNVGLLGYQYECPNLVQMPMEGAEDPVWLLAISINPGAPLGGSITEYFPGEFNGTHYVPFDAAARITDFAKDNYAAQWFYGLPGNEKQVSIGWASNWQYTQQVPTGPSENWRSQMTLPRHNYLKNATRIGYVLVSEPYNIQSIFSRELAFNSSLGNSSLLLDYSALPSGALYFEANITRLSPSTISSGQVNFTFTSSISGEFVRGGTTVNGDTWLDRGKTVGFDNPYFTDKFSSSSVYSGAENGTWSISGVIDRSILEVFVNGAEQSGTMTFYATRPLDTMRLAAGGVAENVTVSVGVWGLVDAWEGMADGNGTVRGNVTTGGGRGSGNGSEVRLF